MAGRPPRRGDPGRTAGRAFAGLALFAAAAFAIGLVFLPDIQQREQRMALVSGLGAALLLGIAAAWLLLRRALVRPLEVMGRDLELAAHAQPGAAAERPSLPDLGALSDGARLLIERFAALRRETGEAAARAAVGLEEQKRRLEAILLDLTEGVLVCNRDHQILLYNRAAMRLLGAAEEIGLGRSLFGLVTREPVLHTLEILGGQGTADDADAPVAAVVAATVDARTLLKGRMSLVAGAGGTPAGYVLSFADVSAEVADLAKRDSLLRAATEGLRGPVANIRASAETLPNVPAGERARFEGNLADESARLAARIEALAGQYRALTVGQWPMDDVYSADLVSCAAQHLKERAQLELTMIGIPLWLRADSHAVLLALEHLVERLASATGAKSFDVEPLLADQRVYLDISWPGAPVPSREIDHWLEAPLAGALGGSTLHQVLERHGSEIWSFAGKDRAALRLPLPSPQRPQFRQRRTGFTARPEFYDFDLMARGRPAPERDRPLAELDFVVFDTETTGLRPEADEIVAIGAVRIVNRRILTGETFERIVHPGRPIPPASTRFHGLTDAMVEGKPPIAVVLPQFHAFAKGATLVAHNASFDMSFLVKSEAAAGVRFGNPALCTLTLAAATLEDMPEHSLDAVAQRFGIAIERRHTALSDAMATAVLFLHLLDVLEGRGIKTLGQALSASGSIAELRKRRMQA
ncbi:MAG: exonuclease domain-containing protein [Alphaproteobacteria bacterium]